jgi:hypothetical protein
MLDKEARGIVAEGPPRSLLESSPNPQVRTFLSRGEGKA